MVGPKGAFATVQHRLVPSCIRQPSTLKEMASADPSQGGREILPRATKAIPAARVNQLPAGWECWARAEAAELALVSARNPE
jgi:hypothetical protein